MKKTSIASLQERLSDWMDWDMALYQIGACLGFWPEFGAPPSAEGYHDPWHGAKGTVWSASLIGDALTDLITGLVEEGCVERRDEPEIQYRWNPKYKGAADILTILA